MSRVLPILFNTDMVRAILDGRKTVTRRIIKPQQLIGLLPDKCKNGTPNEFLKEKKYMFKPYCDTTDAELIRASYNPPYQPGDILYVRETWERFDCCNCEGDEHGNCPKEPKKSVLDKYGFGCYMYRATDEISGDAKWHPSIHMPKEAARIWLKVKDVRVERLKDITEEQAKAEGIREYSKDGKLWKYAVTDDWWISYHHKYRKFFVGSWWQDMPRTAKEAFHHLWNSTLGRRDTPEWYANNWSGNPWVWVIEFERCEKPEGW